MAFLAAALPQIAGLVGLGVFMGGTNGVKSATQVTSLRKSLCSLNKTVSTINEQYSNVLTNQDSMIASLQNNLTKNTTNLGSLVSKITLYKQDYDQTMKQLDTNAILFVATLALLYIISKFNLLNLIFKAL